MIERSSTSESVQASEESGERALYEHVKRREWGLAILAWEQATKRGYQFEDGELRVFKKGFYEMMREVEQPERAAELVTELRRKAGLAAARQQEGRTGSRDSASSISFSDQLEAFRRDYPRGFEDEEWLFNVRGTEAKRQLKRHRQPAIDQAKELLTSEKLMAAAESDEPLEAITAIADLLSRTSLVRPSDLESLRSIGPIESRTYLKTLHEILHTDVEPMDRRFEAFAGAHPNPKSWPVVTAPAALYAPHHHVCVHPTVLRRQAAALAPGLSCGTKPNGRTYQRLLALAERVREKLIAANTTPRDLMDVFDFMRITLSPTARRKMSN